MRGTYTTAFRDIPTGAPAARKNTDRHEPGRLASARSTGLMDDVLTKLASTQLLKHRTPSRRPPRQKMANQIADIGDRQLTETTLRELIVAVSDDDSFSRLIDLDTGHDHNGSSP